MVDEGRRRREWVLDLLACFPAMTAAHVADILFAGRLRPANRVLLALHKAGRVHRVRTGRGGYAYAVRKPAPGQLEHSLAIADVYAALARTRPEVRGAANVQLCPGLITDLLAVAPGRVLLTEVHRGSNPFGDKLQRYAAYRDSGEWREAPWYVPPAIVTVWVVAPAQAVPWLDRAAQPYRATGMRVVVSDLAAAIRDPWDALGAGEARQTGRTIRWALPERRGAGG